MKEPTSYNKITTTALIVLWIGSIIFCVNMIYNWSASDKTADEGGSGFINPKNIFVDQLLLSSKDLELGKNVNLININLNKVAGIPGEDSTISTFPERKLVYSKIFQQKIKTISTKNSDGFSIKPLPE